MFCVFSKCDHLEFYNHKCSMISYGVLSKQLTDN